MKFTLALLSLGAIAVFAVPNQRRQNDLPECEDGTEGPDDLHLFQSCMHMTLAKPRRANESLQVQPTVTTSVFTEKAQRMTTREVSVSAHVSLTFHLRLDQAASQFRAGCAHLVKPGLYYRYGDSSVARGPRSILVNSYKI